MVEQHRLLAEALAEVEDVFTYLVHQVEQDLAMETLEVEHLVITVDRLDLDQVQGAGLVRQRQLAEAEAREQLDVEKLLTLMDQLKIMDAVVSDQGYQIV
jgi:hypothetical protein